MRLPLLVSGILILLLTKVSLASEQSPELASANPSRPALAIDGPGVANPLLLGATTEPTRQWSVDVLLGAPVAVRVQHGLGSVADPCWVVEGLFGTELQYPMGGVGIRRRFVPLSGEHHSLVIAPGVDAYLVRNEPHSLLPNLFGGGKINEVLAGDVDVFWQHRISDHLDGMFGLKLGAGISVFHQGGMPLIALFAGCRF